MIWIAWDKPEPNAYDCLLYQERVYVAFEFAWVWVVALRLLWELWLAMAALALVDFALWTRRTQTPEIAAFAHFDRLAA